MITLLVSLALGEVMWGERAKKTCFEYSGGSLRQVSLGKCNGVRTYYFKDSQGRVRPQELGGVVLKPLKLARPGQVLPPVQSIDAYPWKDCADKNGITSPYPRGGEFRRRCAPDTLYSWQRCSVVDVLVKNSTSINFFPINRVGGYFYGWRTPLGTSNYNNGECSVRIKLRPDIEFIQFEDNGLNTFRRRCMYHPKAQRGEAIITRRWSRGHEYIICSPKAVESWSTGTPEHLEEMEREFEWVTSHKSTEFDSFIQTPGCVLRNAKSNFSPVRKALSGVRLLLHSMPKTKVFHSKESDGTRESHFGTKDPSYFNPRGLK